MTIIEAINQADALCHNAYPQKQKIVWLSRLESMVYRTVIENCRQDITIPIDPETGKPPEDFVLEETRFEGFNEDTDLNTELVIGEPWDDAYVHWLQAQIHLTNAENDLYNTSASMFSSSFEAWKGWYIQHHKPKHSGRFRF